MMTFIDKAGQNKLLNFVDLLKKMLEMDKNSRITPLKVLEHPFLSMEQNEHSSHNNENLTVDVKEASTHECVHCSASISPQLEDNAAETESELDPGKSHV